MAKRKNESPPDEYPGPPSGDQRGKRDDSVQAQAQSPPPVKHAFRCKNCGRYHTAADAGEAATPAACKVCGKGVRFSPNGLKTMDPDNWEVLADTEHDRLEEIGLSPDHVESHDPSSHDGAGENLRRAEESLKILEEKERNWKSATEEEWVHGLEGMRARMGDLENRSRDATDPPTLARIEEERARLRADMTDVVNAEWTDRDEEHRAELQAVVAAEGKVASRRAKSIFAHGVEKPGAADRS